MDRMYAVFSNIRDRKGVRPLTSKLGRARQLLSHVPRSRGDEYLQDPMVEEPSKLPPSRPSYPFAVALAKMILSGSGLELRSSTGSITLPPMMISMEAAFESYLRKVLQTNADDLLVKDGNLAPPKGASELLFHKMPIRSQALSSRSTPDIVCSLKESPQLRLIVEVKYKPDTSRDDFNQVLGYSLTFRTSIVVLASPRKSSSSPVGLVLVGEVSSVHLYSYFIDLGASDLGAQE